MLNNTISEHHRAHVEELRVDRERREEFNQSLVHNAIGVSVGIVFLVMLLGTLGAWFTILGMRKCRKAKAEKVKKKKVMIDEQTKQISDIQKTLGALDARLSQFEKFNLKS